jgi:hypothetical protein
MFNIKKIFLRIKRKMGALKPDLVDTSIIKLLKNDTDNNYLKDGTINLGFILIGILFTICILWYRYKNKKKREKKLNKILGNKELIFPK